MILVHREDGAKPLPEILEKVGCKPNSGCGSVSLLYKTNATKQTNDALAERKDAFNQKGNGESTVIVADAKDYSEGVSFFQVDYMAIVNPPSTWGSFLQRIGRVLRACDTPLREIFICMYVAKIPNQLTFDKAVYNKLPNTLKKAVSWVINEYATDDQKKAWGARSRSARSRSRKPKGPCKGLKRDDCKGECEWTKKNQSKRNACWPRENGYSSRDLDNEYISSEYISRLENETTGGIEVRGSRKRSAAWIWNDVLQKRCTIKGFVLSR